MESEQPSNVIFVDDKSTLAIICRPLFPHFFENGNFFVTIVVDSFCSAFAADTPDILRKFSMKGNGKYEKENVKVCYIGALFDNPPIS